MRHQQTITLCALVAAYAAGAFLPSPGLWLRSELAIGALHINGVQLLLATLMLLLGLMTNFADALNLREHLSGHVIFWTTRIAVGSALMFVVFAAERPLQEVGAAILLASVLPAAGSASGWILASRANETVGSSIIGGTTLTSVVLTPVLLAIFARVQTPEMSGTLEALGMGYQGRLAVLFVCLPLLIGITIRSILEAKLEQVRTSVIRHFNLVLLLLLNYANACVCLPTFIQSPTLTLSMGIVFLVCISLIVTAAIAYALARLCKLTAAAGASTLLCTSMSNTGVGLVLATDALPGAALLHTTLIVYTLLQHVVAGLATSFLIRPDVRNGYGFDREKTTMAQPRSAISGGLPGTKTGANAAGTGSASAGASGSRNEVISTGDSAGA